jgi:hypothetical protein
MITVDEAKSIVEEHFEGSKPQSAYKYGDDFYMIIAPSGENDHNDPFYIVGIADGKYRFLNPLEDIDKFNKCWENGPIKVFST